jgi:hypothetical protein
VFSVAEREEIRARLLASAQADARVVSAAITGSAAGGSEDAWSDVDLALGIADGVAVDAVIADWTELVRREFEPVHHWDLPFGPTIFRVFLLANGLQVDLAFTPAAQFGAYGPNFRLVFGEQVEREPAGAPARDELVGFAWLYVLHARSSIERRQFWKAEYFISGARDYVLTLACARLALPAADARGFDRLPNEVKARLKGAFVQSLEPDELRRALRVVTDVLLQEVREQDPALAARLAGPLVS